MNRRRFLTMLGIAPVVAKAVRPSNDLIKNWRSYLKHHTTTLYAGAENEKWIEDNARMIRTALASRNVQSKELDAIDAAYKQSIRQRIGNEERPLSELVRATREYYEKWGVRAKATWQPDGTIIVEPA